MSLRHPVHSLWHTSTQTRNSVFPPLFLSFFRKQMTFTTHELQINRDGLKPPSVPPRVNPRSWRSIFFKSKAASSKVYRNTESIDLRFWTPQSWRWNFSKSTAASSKVCRSKCDSLQSVDLRFWGCPMWGVANAELFCQDV